MTLFAAIKFYPYHRLQSTLIPMQRLVSEILEFRGTEQKVRQFPSIVNYSSSGFRSASTEHSLCFGRLFKCQQKVTHCIFGSRGPMPLLILGKRATELQILAEIPSTRNKRSLNGEVKFERTTIKINEHICTHIKTTQANEKISKHSRRRKPGNENQKIKSHVLQTTFLGFFRSFLEGFFVLPPRDCKPCPIQPGPP